MTSTSTNIFPKKHRAKITSKGQITIPVEIRRLLGAHTGDELAFEPTTEGVKVIRQLAESPFDKFRGIGNGIPELDGTRDSIIRYFREMRGHDEIDDLIVGSNK